MVRSRVKVDDQKH